jgi:hypothetical protein
LEASALSVASDVPLDVSLDLPLEVSFDVSLEEEEEEEEESWVVLECWDAVAWVLAPDDAACALWPPWLPQPATVSATTALRAAVSTLLKMCPPWCEWSGNAAPAP